ncbi:putative acyl carrier protein [Streptomyces sp. NBRC 110611]|uniref:acyl carrier protein n=1 Tax=Streptomyces sp. NBRC 110611 TaxID=1621259 RepID=UPI000856102D|nr:phosphopantetheine-binding protein [Streptomyces sp. NBRC 110611]GAU68950.1 putative acyl carrier protein [Streptomyces sp. NBRC 110611]
MSVQFEQLKEILVTRLRVAEEQVTPEATWEDIELDSLAMVELSLMLEENCGLQIGDDELLETPTISDMVRLMEERSTKA